MHIVCGAPASGKTFVATELARKLGAALIDSDVATEAVVRAGLAAAGQSADDRDSDAYKAVYREPVYETLYGLAAANLGHLPVVLAGPFTRESQDADWPTRLEARFGVPVHVHFVRAPDAIRQQRMAARGEARDAAKLADFEAHAATCARAVPPFPHVLVDND